MRQRSSDSSKSNSTVTTTDYGPLLTPTNPTSMRTPIAWQNRDEAFLIGSRNVSRPQSSAHTRRSINVHRTHQQKIQEQKQNAAQTAAAVIAAIQQQKSVNNGHHNKNYNQNSSFSSTKPKPLHQRSSSSSSITKSLINKQQQLHKQLQQQQQFLKQQMLHRKTINDNSSSPSVATSSDDREEIPIVKHSRRTAASRASNNPSMISQLTRHSQLVTIPQAALLTTSNASTRQEAHCLPSSAYHMRNNATLRSTRSVPAIVYHQQQQAQQQQQQLIHQQMLYNHHQNSNNFNNAIDNLDSCPVHGTNAINSLTANHNNSTAAIHQNQLLPTTQISNNRSSSILNIRKFASVNDLSNRPTTAVNYIQTANSQLMPVFTVANHHNLSTSIKANQMQQAIRNSAINDAKLAMTTNLLPLPIHPAVATASTIYSQPIQIARPTPVLIPTAFTTEPNFAIAKHNKDQLLNIVNSNQADSYCKGHLVVLWIILSIVVVGIVSGIILGLTI